MARLIYEITGDISGLENSLNQASNLIKEAGAKSSQLNINIPDISPQIKAGVAALDQLDQKLAVITGNATLFGDSVKLQTQEVGAYQTAINALLSNGFTPMDGDVQRLKQHVDDLSASLKNVKNVQPPGSFVNVTSSLPSQENVFNPNLTGAIGQQSELITALNEQLALGTITLQQYNQAILGANSSLNLLGESTVTATGEIESEIGIIAGLKRALADLNSIRLNTLAEGDLPVLNAEIQQTEVEIQRLSNIGKQGFDSFGNSIKGVSVSSINGQLVSLSNNLFGARQISRDLVRTLDAGSLQGFAKAIGLLAVDFLYFAQNAQFAAGATTVASAAIATEEGVATGASISTQALGAAFKSLLTPVNLIILGVAAAGAAFVAFEHSQKTAAQTAAAHTKAIQDEKKVLEDYISTLSDSQRAESAGANFYAENIVKLDSLVTSLRNTISARQDDTTALEALQAQFPQYFANLTQASAQTDALTLAYKNAREAIVDLAIAQGAQNLGKKAAEDYLNNLIAQKQAATDYAKAQKNYNTILKETLDLNIDISSRPPAQLAQAKGELVAATENYNKYRDAALSASDALKQFEDLSAQFGKQAKDDNSLNRIGFLESEISALQKILPHAKDYETVLAKIKADQDELKALEGKTVDGPISNFDNLKQKLDEVIQKSSSLAVNSGISGYASEVSSIVKQFTDLNNLISVFANSVKKAVAAGTITSSQAVTLLKPLPAIKNALPGNEDAQINQARIKNATATADAIQKINDQFGIKEQAGFNEELSRIKKLYDGIVQEAQKNSLTLQQIEQNKQAAIAEANGDPKVLADIDKRYTAQIQQAKDAQAKIATANADLLPAIQAIDEKYIQQETETYGKILDIANQAFEALDTGEAARTDKINLEWQKRITSANAYFDKLRDLAKASNLSPSATANINAIQTQVNAVIKLANTKQISEELSKNFATAMQSAVDGFVLNFYTSLTSLGQQRQDLDNKYAAQLANASDQTTRDQINNLKKIEQQSTLSFGAIFSSLVSKFNATFNESILNSFTKQFTENLGKTLIAPTGKQLTISPEQQSAQNVALLLKNAGNDLAQEIKQAGVDFASTVKNININPGLLNGTSGGTSLGGASLAASAAGSQIGSSITTAGTNFNESVSSGGAEFASAVGGAAAAASVTTTTSATTAGASITSAGAQLSTKIAGAAAALSLVGGLISGATSPTSSVGQGVGGALQGAGEGALIGSVIPGLGTVAGAVIGGVIGGISGLLGASKAKKQEELQQKQLEQQQETNALLARQNALAYTTAIIGRMTTEGIVTGADINAFGQLTATISGKNIQFVLDRSTNGR